MKKRATHLLLFTLAALLALPQGWCCFVSAKPFVAAPEAVETGDCCCPTKGKPVKQAPADDFTPPPCPVAFCCCDPIPATMKTSDLDSPAEDALAFPPLVAVAPGIAPTGLTFYTPPRSSRPLHLLRCVWLC